MIPVQFSIMTTITTVKTKTCDMKLNAVGVLYINALSWTKEKLTLGVVSCSFWAAQCMASITVTV